MSNRKKPNGGMRPNDALTVEQTKEETGAQAMARKLLQPTLKNAAAASAYTDKMMGAGHELPGIGDYADHVHAVTNEAAGGDIAMASRILSAQAIALDSMFAELARRAALNMGEYINATERYGRLALKAQSNCRATLEALAKLHQPREQTVRHVHVSDGGQAIVADEFHHHGGSGNGKAAEQSHEPRAQIASCTTLPSPNATGNGVPVPKARRPETVQAPRRKGGRAQG